MLPLAMERLARARIAPILIVGLVAAIAIGACGSASTVDDDPLTNALGNSGVVLAEAREQLDVRQLENGIGATARHDVDATTRLLEPMIKGDLRGVDMAQVRDLAAHPGRPFRATRASKKRVESLAARIRGAKVPGAVYQDSDDAMRRFVQTWNDYVATQEKGARTVAGFFGRMLRGQRPIGDLAAAVIDVVDRRDGDRWFAASDRANRMLRSTARDSSSFTADMGRIEAEGSRLLRQLIDQANGDEDVSALVDVLRNDYAKSLWQTVFVRGGEDGA